MEHNTVIPKDPVAEEDRYNILLNLLHLQEIELPALDPSLSLFVSMIYWRLTFKDEDFFAFNQNEIRQQALRLRRWAKAVGDTLHSLLRIWAEDMQVETYLVEDSSVVRIYESSDNTKCAIFGRRKGVQVTPLTFDPCVTHPVSSIQFSQLVNKHIAETLSNLEATNCKGTKELHIALGSSIKTIMDLANAEQQCSGVNVVFFGRQGIGKSYMLNRILEYSLRSKQESGTYIHELSYWISFQKFKEITIEPIYTEEPENSIYHDHSSFIEVPHDDERLSLYYLLPEGHLSSTTRLNATISYGIQCAITFEFFSAREVEMELDTAKNFDLNLAEEGEETEIKFRALQMIGVRKKLLEVTGSDLRIDPHFQDKLGAKVTFTSPYTSLSDSLQYLKAKYATYCGVDKHYWGLIKSVTFKLPLPILKNGGQLIDCPGLVHKDFLLKRQTEDALKIATHVVFVCDTGDIPLDFDLLEKSKFMRKYKADIVQSFLNNELENMPSKCVIACNIKQSNEITEKDMQDHADKINERIQNIFQKYIIKSCKALFPINIRNQAKILSGKLQRWYFDSSMTYLKPETRLSGAGLQIFNVNCPAQAPEIYMGPFALTHLFFQYDGMTDSERGVDFFMNSLAHMVCQNQIENTDQIICSNQLFSTIENCIQQITNVSQKLDSVAIENAAGKRLASINTKFDYYKVQMEEWYNDISTKVKARLTDCKPSLNNKFSMEKLKKHIIEQTKVFGDRDDENRFREFINSICLGKGRFSCYSLSDIVLKPIWKEIDQVLTSIGQLILYDKDADDFVPIDNGTYLLDIVNNISQYVFKISEQNNTDVWSQHISFEKLKFLVEVKNEIKQFDRLPSIVAAEKATLQISLARYLRTQINAKESRLPRAAKKINYRNAYIQGILLEFVQTCTDSITKKLSERIDSLLRKIAGLDEKDQTLCLISNIQSYFQRGYYQHILGRLNYQYDFSIVRSYFQAVHLSTLRCAIDPSLSYHNLKNLILDAYTKMKFEHVAAIKFFIDSMEWNDFTAKKKCLWTFEEKKFVVNQIKNFIDNPEMHAASLPAKAMTEVKETLLRTYPIANRGARRGDSAIRQMLKTYFNKSLFTTAQLAINHVNNALNRSHALQIAFNLQNEPDLADLVIQKYILMALTDEQMASNNLKLEELTDRVNQTLDEQGYEDVLTPDHIIQFVNSMKREYKSRREALRFVLRHVDQSLPRGQHSEEYLVPDEDEDLIESDEINNEDIHTPQKRKLRTKEKNAEKRRKTN